MATKTFTEEQLNFFRLCSVITDDVPKGLRKIFKQQWDARYQATHGQWLDVPKNATDFYSMESSRNQRRNARLLAIMANGNTNQWDCTCLFYAILFSDCVGSFLSTTIKKSVDELREIRNEAFAHTADGRLTDVDFEDAMRKIVAAFNALGLDTTQVNEIKTQKSFLTDELSDIQQKLKTEKKRYAKLHSFCILPPKPSHETTDRADEVKKINHEMEKLRSTKKNETTIIYLSGNPGCGKSEIARQIGNKYFNELQEEAAELKFVFTFNASSIDTLLQSYVAFAASLSCDEDSISRTASSNDLSSEDKITQIKGFINPKLKIYSSWLIIVDNVNDLKLVSKYLPHTGEKTSGDGQILVTTQDSQSILLDSFKYHYSSLREGMKEDDAIALLSQISGTPGDRDTLLEIVRTLDFQPLALACAAVYMQRISDTKWEKYLLKLQEGKREATEEAYKKTSSTYLLTMTTAVRLALERVVSEDKIMMYAFQFLSVIDNEPIPLKYVVQYVMNYMPDEDQDFVAAHISSSSLVISSEDLEMLKEVRVHQVIYNGLQKLDIGKTNVLNMITVFSELVSFHEVYNVKKSETIATRPLAPHFVVISKKLEHLLELSNLIVESPLIPDCLLKAGCISLVHDNYKASEIFLQLCLSIQQRDYDKCMTLNKAEEGHSYFLGKQKNVIGALATTHKSLGHLYIQERDFKKAQTHLEAALAFEDRLHKGDCIKELAVTLKKLGFCLTQLGQNEEAEAYLQRALKILEKNHGENDPLLAGILVTMVGLLQSQGKFKKAKTYCERVLELEQNLYGSEDTQLADTLHDFGVYLSRLNEVQKAITFYRKALKIQEKVYHADHSRKVTALRNLGFSLIKLGKFEQAKVYLERALSICEKGNNENKLQLAGTLHVLGRCLYKQGEYEKAQAYLERALSIREKESNENKLQLAGTLHVLGRCLYEQWEYVKAQAYLERALSIREKESNENKLQLADTLRVLGRCLYEQREYEKAQTYLERALSIGEKESNENKLHLADTLYVLGVCLYDQGEYKKAQAYLERALDILDKESNENKLQLADTLRVLGGCLYEQREYEKAQAYLERALFILEKEGNESDPHLAATLANLSFCLNEQGQYEKAKAYKERARSSHEKEDDA